MRYRSLLNLSRLVPAAILLVATGCASAPVPMQTQVGLAGLPPEITVAEWPFWVDIPIESKDPARIWGTVVEVVSERAAIAVLDRESGYLRTEWRPVDLAVGMILTDAKGRVFQTPPPNYGATGEERYTFRLRPSESKIRMGIEARLMPSQRSPAGLRNVTAAPWVSIHRELQDRLAVMK
jgi:hypothetical protein